MVSVCPVMGRVMGSYILLLQLLLITIHYYSIIHHDITNKDEDDQAALIAFDCIVDQAMSIVLGWAIINCTWVRINIVMASNLFVC